MMVVPPYPKSHLANLTGAQGARPWAFRSIYLLVVSFIFVAQV
jgi:hypothetical protein